MVAPDHPAHEPDNDSREHHDRVAEQGLLREGGDDLRDDAQGRQDEDVDLGVAEHPEQMLPEHGVATGRDVEEVGSEEPVEHQLDQGDGDDREGQDQ